MKKILLSLTIISSLFLVSCEDEFAPENEENFENNTSDTSDIRIEYFGYWDYSCKTVYDSIEVLICDSFKQGTDTLGFVGEKDTNMVYIQPYVPCYTTIKVIQKVVCDSVWIEKYEIPCDSSIQKVVCDSVLIEKYGN